MADTEKGRSIFLDGEKDVDKGNTDTETSSTSSRYYVTDGKLTEIVRIKENDEVESREQFKYDDNGNIEGKAYYDEKGNITGIDVFSVDDKGHIDGIDHLDAQGKTLDTEIITRDEEGRIVEVDHYTDDKFLSSKDLYENGTKIDTQEFERTARVIETDTYKDEDKTPSLRQIDYKDDTGETEYSRLKIYNKEGAQVSDLRQIKLDDGTTIKTATDRRGVTINAYDKDGKLTDSLKIGDKVTFSSYIEKDGKIIERDNPCYYRENRVVFGNKGINSFFDKGYRFDNGVNPTVGMSKYYAEKIGELSEKIENEYKEVKVEQFRNGQPYRIEEHPDEIFRSDGKISDITYYDSEGNAKYTENFNYDEDSVKIEGYSLEEDRSRVEVYDENGICVESYDKDSDNSKVINEDRIGTILEENYPDYFGKDTEKSESGEVSKTEIMDDKFRTIETTFYEDGKQLQRAEYSYNEDGLVDKITSRDADDNINGISKYEYDEKGELMAIEKLSADGELLSREDFTDTDESNDDNTDSPDSEPLPEDTPEENDNDDVPSEESSPETDDESPIDSENEESDTDDNSDSEESQNSESQNEEDNEQDSSGNETDETEQNSDEPGEEQGQPDDTSDETEPDASEIEERETSTVYKEEVDGEIYSTEISYDDEGNISFIKIYSGEDENEALTHEYMFVPDGTLVAEREYDIDTGRSREDYSNLGKTVGELFPQYVEDREEKPIESETDVSEQETSEVETVETNNDSPTFEENSEQPESGSVRPYRAGLGDGAEYIDSTGDIRADEWHSDDGKSYSYVVYEENSSAGKDVTYDDDDKKYTVNERDHDGNTTREIIIDCSNPDALNVVVVDYEYDENGRVVRSEEALAGVTDDNTFIITSGFDGESVEIALPEGDENVDINSAIAEIYVDEIKYEVEDIKENLNVSGIRTDESVYEEESEPINVDAEIDNIEYELQNIYDEKFEELEEVKEKFDSFDSRVGNSIFIDTYESTREALLDKYNEAMERYSETGDFKAGIEAKEYLSEIKDLDSKYENLSEMVSGDDFSESEKYDYLFTKELKEELEKELAELKECLDVSDSPDVDEMDEKDCPFLEKEQIE